MVQKTEVGVLISAHEETKLRYRLGFAQSILFPA